jgi:hypothetical protein
MDSENEVAVAVSGISEQQTLTDLLVHQGLDSLFIPAPRSGVVSAWYGHVPFAYCIMAMTRPRCLVELGTHNGVSYAAFCDAASRIGVETRCFAVDTWQGDEHAGYYGEEKGPDLLLARRLAWAEGAVTP